MKYLLAFLSISLAFTCQAESEVVDGVTWHYTPWKHGVAVRRDPTHDFNPDDYDARFRWEFGRADLKIPSRLGGRPVLRIENDTFADGLMKIKSIDIPSTVEEIGDRAFIQCYGLTSLSIPRGVRKIGHRAFMNCYLVKKLELPSALTEIGVETFAGMALLKTIVAPESVEKRFSSSFPHSPKAKWRRSRTPWVVGFLALISLLVFRKPLFRLIRRKEPQK